MFNHILKSRLGRIGGLLPVTCSVAFAEHQSSKSDVTNNTEMIAVFLKPQSKDLLLDFFKKRGMVNKSADYVAMYSAAQEADSYVFRPLFGERAAFRLTGLLTLEDGSIVGMGRLSNMIGEIHIDDREICMPIFNNGETCRGSDASTIKLLDSATLFGMGVPGGKQKFHWKGRIPGNKVGSVVYAAQRGQYVRIPTAEQIVVDGYICSNKYCSSEGVCEYDRSQELENSLVLKEDIEKSKSGSIVRVNENPKVAESADETCPVCRYMKGGPCKQQFLEWDGCIKALEENQELRDCFSPTKSMMYCMKEYEYYDIMTAGTDYRKLDLASSTDNNESSSNSNSSGGVLSNS